MTYLIDDIIQIAKYAKDSANKNSPQNNNDEDHYISESFRITIPKGDPLCAIQNKIVKKRDALGKFLRNMPVKLEISPQRILLEIAQQQKAIWDEILKSNTDIKKCFARESLTALQNAWFDYSAELDINNELCQVKDQITTYVKSIQNLINQYFQLYTQNSATAPQETIFMQMPKEIVEALKNATVKALLDIMEPSLPQERQDLPAQVLLRRFDTLAELLANSISICIATTYDEAEKKLIISSNVQAKAFENNPINDNDFKALKDHLERSILLRVKALKYLCTSISKIYKDELDFIQMMDKSNRLALLGRFISGNAASLRWSDAEPCSQVPTKTFFLSKEESIDAQNTTQSSQIVYYLSLYAADAVNENHVVFKKKIDCPVIINFLKENPTDSHLAQCVELDVIYGCVNKFLIKNGADYLLDMQQFFISPFIKGGTTTSSFLNPHAVEQKLAKLVDLFLFDKKSQQQGYTQFNYNDVLSHIKILYPTENKELNHIQPSNFHAEQLIMDYFRQRKNELKLIGLNKLLCAACSMELHTEFPHVLVSGQSNFSFPNVYRLITRDKPLNPTGKTVNPNMQRSSSDPLSPQGSYLNISFFSQNKNDKFVLVPGSPLKTGRDGLMSLYAKTQYSGATIHPISQSITTLDDCTDEIEHALDDCTDEIEHATEHPTAPRTHSYQQNSGNRV